MSYRIRGLDPTPFAPLYGLPEAQLAELGIKRYLAKSNPGYPDRIELRDADPGETVLLLNFVHQPASTPYRASHAIYVIEGAVTPFDSVDRIPPVLGTRTLSVRGFDQNHMMIAGEITEGCELGAMIEKMFADPGVLYLQAHYAKRGCYAARIDRA
ncbi:MAG: DUF1203 domain-containing protein [Burkholderiaceae bacterium]|jgi:hypothetical protein